MTNMARLYGSNDVDALFQGHPVTSAPFPLAGGRKRQKNFDEGRVRAVLEHPDQHEMTDIDPRTLHATQPQVTRAGVQHYMSNPHGPTYADQGNAGNDRPMVYARDDGRNLLLSGHHRASTALLRGEQFKAVVVRGPWGPER